MAPSPTTDPSPPPEPASHTSLDAPTRASLDHLNSGVSRMLAHLPSDDPYVQIIPQDGEVKYRHTYAFQMRQWTENTPFRETEHEAAQYTTWKWMAQELRDKEDPIHLVSSRTGEEGKAKYGSANTVGATGKQNGRTPKTKILSLADYKRKQNGGTPEVDAKDIKEQKEQAAAPPSNSQDANGLQDVEKEGPKKVAVKGPVERLKADEDILASVEELKKKDEAAEDTKMMNEKADRKDVGGQELKRKREDSAKKIGSGQKNAPFHDREHDKKDQHAAEKARISPPPTQEPSKNEEEGAALGAQPANRAPSPAKSGAKSPGEKAAAPAALKEEVKPAPKPKTTTNPVSELPPKPSAKSKEPQEPPKKKTEKITAKSASTSPDKSAAQSTPGKESSQTSGSPDQKQTGMPPRLSPLHYRSVDETKMPSRITNELPANILATLAARAARRTAGDSSDPEKALMSKKTQDGVSKVKSHVPKNGFRANPDSPAIRSTGGDAARKRSSVARPRSDSPEESQEGEVRVERAGKGKRISEQQDEKKSLIVKLAYKKSGAPSVRRILGMRQNPKPTPVEKPDVAGKEEPKRVKGLAQKVGPSKAAAALKAKEETTKHKAEEDDESDKAPPASKKPRMQKEEATKRKTEGDDGSDEAPPPSKKPKTQKESAKFTQSRDERRSLPAKPDVSAPTGTATKKPKQQPASATPTTSKKDPAPSTPREPETPGGNPKSVTKPPGSTRKDLLATTLTNSTPRDLDSKSTAATPSASARSSPPSSSQQPNGAASSQSKTAPTSNPQQAGPQQTPQKDKTPKQLAWEAQQKRLELLGRDLKHAVPKHAGANEDTLAAVKALESLLAYMLAFTCAERATSADSPKLPALKLWRSLHAYFGFVHRSCEPHPALAGLACHLGLVLYAHTMRLAAGAAHDALSREELLKTQALMLKAGEDADALLGFDALAEVLPATWKGRLKGAAVEREREREKEGALDPDRGFQGGYALPMGVHTGPLQAVRAAHRALLEWITTGKGKEGGKGYALKLKL